MPRISQSSDRLFSNRLKFLNDKMVRSGPNFVQSRNYNFGLFPLHGSIHTRLNLYGSEERFVPRVSTSSDVVFSIKHEFWTQK